jgi:hypothetical protein
MHQGYMADKGKMKKLKHINHRLKKYKHETEAKLKAAEQKEANDWLNVQMKEGKVLPKSKAVVLKGYMAAKAAGDLALFKEDVENRPAAVMFEDIRSEEFGKGEGQHRKITFKSSTDEVDAEVRLIMKEQKVDYVQATEILQGRMAEEQE